MLATQRQPQAGDLRQAAGDQCGAGVGAKTLAVGHAGGDGHDILGSTAHLHADDVAGGVGAEGVAVQVVRQPCGMGSAAGGDGDGCGQATGDLHGKGRPGEYGDIRVRKGFPGYLAHEAPLCRLQTLGRPAQGFQSGVQLPDLLQYSGKGMAGHDHQDFIGAVQAFCKIRAR